MKLTISGSKSVLKPLLAVALFLGAYPTLCPAAGTVTAWGANDTLQCQVPPGLTNVVAVAGGSSHSVALKRDGTVVAWGFNLSGQTTVPAGLNNVWKIAAGDNFSLALKANGSVVAWGGLAQPPAGATNVLAIAAGWSHALALRADMTVISWGSTTAVPEGLDNVVAIAAGNGQSLALRTDGSVVAWGEGSYGKTNVPASALTNVMAIAAGADHCLALQRDGQVIAWGRNNYNQATVPSGLRAVAISGGAQHTVALKTDGTLAAWGNNTYQQTVVNPAETGYVAVSAGGYHNLAIRGDGNPFILQQPASQTVLISKSVTFQVIATGAQPLSYQWRLFGTNLASATASTLPITNVQMPDGGPYEVLIQNVYGSITSTPAILTAMGGVPVVVQAPQDQNVICGDTAAFQVSVGGSSPFNYQWQFNGTPIAGATQNSLLLTNVTASQAGTYTVIAANAYGSAMASAALTVAVEPPAITSALTAAAAQGAAFTYTIVALHSPSSFRAQFLPAGLTLNTNSGVISGTPLESGTFGTRITAINACTSDTQTLVLTISPSLPVITSAPTATGTEGQPFTYQITSTANPTNYGAINLPVGLSVDPVTGEISGVPTYAGTFDATIWASNTWGVGAANLQFTLANATIDNLNIGNLTYNYSKPYLLDFQFSLYTVNGDTNDPAAPTTGLVIDPKLLSATCLEDDVPNSPTETGSFIVQGNTKVVKVYLVLDFTESIASLVNGDQNGDGISDALEFMVNGALDFVNQQSRDTQVGVFEFHRDDQSPTNPVVSLTTDRTLLSRQIAGIYTNYVQGFSSGSRCWDAVLAAIGQLGASNRDEQHYVVFVSDGRDESSATSFSNVVSAATAAAVKVFALGFGSELDATTLQSLTSQTQGRYFDAGNNPSQLAAQFAEITKTSKGQYILRWATLKRPSRIFMPSFSITYNGMTAFSPVNPVFQDTNNPIIDTNSTPPTTNYNNITNFIIGFYNTSSNQGLPAVGSVRVVPNTEVLPTALDFRATYVPRNIRQMRVHYRPNWPCVAELQNSGPGEMLSGWSLTETNDGTGGTWMTLRSSNPTNGPTIPFASFGKLVTFVFNDVINPSNAFSVFDIDNSIYVGAGGQSFTIENTNSFIKNFPVLPFGTPVPWLNAYGYSANYTNAEVADPDGDGMANWQEYRANTNPTNAVSRFVMRGVAQLPDGRVDVTFSTALNRSYRLEGSVDLLTWQTVQDLIPGVGGDITVRDLRFVPGAESMYYRVLVY